jgi:hemolysin activation/secretion protein
MFAHSFFRVKWVRNLLAAGLCLSIESVWAQTAPGDISRQVEPSRTPELPALQLQPQRITQPSQPEPGAQLVRVQQWVLQGNQVLASEDLQALLQSFTGVDVSLQQIREAAAVLQQAYDEAGWLARVDLPPQDITDGRVTLQITEAKLGQVRMDANATSRVATERVQAIIQAQQAVGQPLNTRHLDRGLLLADDLSGVSLVGTLQASALPGATDVVVSAAAQPPYSLDLSLDNTNARSVGAEKLSLSGNWVSPAGFGETYSAQAFKSRGAEYARVAASAPLGYSGLRGSVSLSQLNYEINSKDAQGNPIDTTGRSQNAAIDLTYPLLRSRQANVYLTGGLDEKRLRNFINADLEQHYRVEGGQVGVAGNFFDSWGGGAANSYSITWRHGQVKSGQVEVSDKTAGSFKKLNWNVSRQQALTSQVSLFGAANAQSTGSKELDSGENFSLGGPSGVRAYPVGEASGPQGHVVNLEVRYRLNAQWLVTPFYDRGRVEKRPNNVRCANLTAYSLEGAGVAVGWTGPQGWAAKATYARRLGTNPCLVNGKDQDDKFTKDRVWLSVSRSF